MVFRTLLKLLIAGVFFVPANVEAQEFAVDPGSDPRTDSGYLIQWDSPQNRLVFFRNVDSADAAAVKILGIDGSRLLVYPQKFVPGAQYVDVWAAAATPEGGAVLSAIVGYGPRNSKPPVKSFLMKFDGGGNLTNLWNVAPYHYHLVTVNSRGDIFAFGETDSESSYPLITKYSKEGDVLTQFLQTSQFKNGDAIVASGSANGENELFTEGGKLYLWVARTRDLIRFSENGQTEASLSLAPAFERLEAANDNQHIEVLALTTSPSENIVAQVQLWPKDRTKPVERATVTMSADGSTQELTPTDPRSPARLLVGTSVDGKRVYRSARDGKLILSLE